MRKITKQITNNFLNEKSCHIGNSSVSCHDGMTWLYLHGNCIAKKKGTELWVTAAGWQTTTTKERLNGLPGVNIYQKNFQWYLNGQKWDGEWTQI